MRKGLSPLLSHTLTISFSIVLLITVITVMNSLREDYQKFTGDNEAEQVCNMIKTGIEKIYFKGEYVSPSNDTMGRIEIMLPERIGDMNYRIWFYNSSLKVDSIGTINITKTCKIGFNLSYEGQTTGGKTSVRYVQVNGQGKIIMERLA